MLFKDISLIDEDFQLHHHMYLAIVGNKITYIGNTPPENPAMFGTIYAKSAGKLFIPGMYNAHSHAPMHLLRGYGENLSLNDWLHTRIFPFEDQLTPDDIYWSCLMGIAEMLRFGIVSTTDMYMSGDAMAKAFIDGGIKSNFSVGCTCFDDRSYQQMPAYAETISMIEKYHNMDNQRLKVEFSLHAEYTSTEKITTTLAEAAAKYDSAIHVHVSETADEVAACQERHQGKSPVRYLANCGIFDVPATAAHCVHIDDDDIAILKEKNVSVASCPKSNLKLASGFCPAGKLLKAGVNLALGTDSVASNNNLNMLEEIKTFALIHKGITNDPTLITPAEALYAASRAGALAQGRPDCGALKAGNRADIVAIDLNRLYMQPTHNLLNNLVYAACGSDVFMTMVDGKILYEDGEFTNINIDQILYETEQSCKRILGELATK